VWLGGIIVATFVLPSESVQVMTTVEVSTKLTVDDLIKAVEQLPPQELTKFIRRVIALQTKRGEALLANDEEQALLVTVEKRLRPELQSRLDALREESRKRRLTPSEQAELLQFVQQVEQQDLKRVEALINLAQKRDITVTALMDELG
jgi:hypothetical protein